MAFILRKWLQSIHVELHIISYSFFLSSDGDKEILNEEGGHLLRTKATTTREGGVAAGFAVIDSPLLV